MADEASIDIDLFREQLEPSDNANERYSDLFENKTLKDKLDEYERAIIETTLNSSSNMKEAASKLGIDISTLVRKKQKYRM